MKIVDLWIAFSQQAIDEFIDRRSDPDAYTGPMDNKTFKIMSRMADMENRQRLFNKVDAAGKTYTLFSLVIEGQLSQAQDAIDHITTEWPTHFIVVGAWWFDTGLQVGTNYTYDGDGNITGVTGSAVYPIPTQAYKVMPDEVTYDIDGNETSRTPASSNADLKDVNLILGQAPRDFGDYP